MGTIKILATPNIESVARRVSEQLAEFNGDFSFVPVRREIFANGELKPTITETVRHTDVYLFHNMLIPDVNQAFTELFLTIDAVSRASVDDFTLVLPFMSYMRQDRKDEPRVPISGSLLADLIQSQPAVKRVLTMELHSEQAQGFFRMPVDNLPAHRLHGEYFRHILDGSLDSVIVCSPDVGGAARARNFAGQLGPSVPVSIIEKRRSGANETEQLHYIGDAEGLKGKKVILYDDMIDTGGTIVGAANRLRELGASEVYVAAAHALFSRKKGKQAPEDLFRDAELKVVTTNTIPRSPTYYQEHGSWLTVLPIEKFFARAIYGSSEKSGSVSSAIRNEQPLLDMQKLLTKP